MISGNIDARIIKICAMGLDDKMLGKSIAQLEPTFCKLFEQFGFNICGEGGEYESVTLNCPLFKKRIELIETEVV